MQQNRRSPALRARVLAGPLVPVVLLDKRGRFPCQFFPAPALEHSFLVHQGSRKSKIRAQVENWSSGFSVAFGFLLSLGFALAALLLRLLREYWPVRR